MLLGVRALISARAPGTVSSLVGCMALELVATHIISRLTAERAAIPIVDSRRLGKTRVLQLRTHRMYKSTTRGGQLARTG